MRKIYSFTLIAVGLSAGLLLAQSDSDYQGWMKTVGATNGSLQKNIAAKDGAAASADAAKLADTFKQVASYWEAHSAPDAVGFAKSAQGGFELVGKDAAAGDFDKAAADAKAIGRNCGGCHMAHREKTDAGFKIKWLPISRFSILSARRLSAFARDIYLTTPANGLLAEAYSFFGIRPARNACRPAWTASFIAVAMVTASSASAIAVFIRTPS